LLASSRAPLFARNAITTASLRGAEESPPREKKKYNQERFDASYSDTATLSSCKKPRPLFFFFFFVAVVVLIDGDADGSPITTPSSSSFSSSSSSATPRPFRARRRAAVRVAVIVRETEAELEGDFVDVDDLETDSDPVTVSVVKRDLVAVFVADTVFVADDVGDWDALPVRVFEDDDEPETVVVGFTEGDAEVEEDSDFVVGGEREERGTLDTVFSDEPELEAEAETVVDLLRAGENEDVWELLSMTE
jgi:hypothetical protein